MTYRGHVENGAVVLDEPVALPDGSRVECVLVVVDPPRDKQGKSMCGLYDDLMAFAGKVTGLPEDASENVDHYLYGCSKK